MGSADSAESTPHRQIRVDRDLCMGSAQCLWYAPNTFDQDDSGIAVVIDPRGDPEETIQTAIDSCPARALSLVAAGGSSA